MQTIWKFILLPTIYVLLGQAVVQAQGGYTLVGSARSGATADCIQLTNSGNGQTGALWFTKRLRLTESFELSFLINLGNNPVGADGIVMVFQTQGDHALGGQAGGIGYKGLRPSLGIEFDTNQNFEAGDPPEDHITLVRDGVSDHRLNTGFAPSVPISATQKSVKDGRDHHVDIRWDATTQTLRVAVDCIPRISQSIDLVNAVFLGTPEVIWGFTSTTGARGNAHTVCFLKEEVQPDTVRACRNEQITLTAPLSSNGLYEWSPGTGLDNSRTRTPRLRVGNSQLYTVQYADRCGQPKRDSVFVSAKGPGLSLSDDRQVCENETVTLMPTLTPANTPVTYRWSAGEATPQLNPKTSGLYALTVTGDGCSVSDSARVTFFPLPKLGLAGDSVYNCPGGQPIRLDPRATGQGLQYVWMPTSSAESTLMAHLPGQYAVTITTAAGCSTVQRFTIADNCPSDLIFMPDAFTPNGDGINDVLAWKGQGDKEVQMKIFNRWGDLVFLSRDVALYWDGSYLGSPCSSGVYAWSLDYRSKSVAQSQWVTLKGKVLLVK